MDFYIYNYLYKISFFLSKKVDSFIQFNCSKINTVFNYHKKNQLLLNSNKLFILLKNKYINN